MADYSGFYQCEECNAAGTFYEPAKHKDTCSVPAKIAAHTLEKARKQQAEEVRVAQIEQTWDSLSDEQFIEKLAQFSVDKDELYAKWSQMDEVYRIAHRYVYVKNLSSEFTKAVRKKYDEFYALRENQS